MSLQSVLDTMTYKPTYSFEIVDINGSEVLRITMHTHDSRPAEAPPLSIPVDFPVPDHGDDQPGTWVRVIDPASRHSVTIQAPPDDYWRNWLQEKITWCELHESAEWLRFDGVLYRDPHNESMIR